jgi:hypothetical protein
MRRCHRDIRRQMIVIIPHITGSHCGQVTDDREQDKQCRLRKKPSRLRQWEPWTIFRRTRTETGHMIVG